MAASGLEVPRAALMAAQQEWMPHLLTEVANYQKGIKPPLPEKPKPTPAPSAPPDEKKSSGDESLLGGEDLSAAPSPAKPAPASGGDLLAGGEEDLTSATPTPAPSGEGEDLTSGDLLQGAPAPTPPASPTPEPTPEAKPAEEWVAAGGWYRPSQSFTLYYRPRGHADPFLVAWLNAAARSQNEMPERARQTPFQRMADPQSPGLCLKCHTVEKNDGVLAVNWMPAQPNENSRPFTTFSHTTHFSIVGTAGCQACHALNAEIAIREILCRRQRNGSERNEIRKQFRANLESAVCGVSQAPHRGRRLHPLSSLSRRAGG